MKKLLTLCSATMLSSALMANYMMYVNENDEVTEEYKCSSVDSLKLVDTNISVYANPRTVPYTIHESLSLTFGVESASDTVKITYNNGAGVTVVNPYPDIVQVTSDGEQVSVNCVSELKDVVYLLSGSSDNGCFYIESPRKFTIVMNNLDLTSQTVISPIRSMSGKTMNIVLPTGTVNKLTDSANDTCNAVIRSKGQIVFSELGNGELTVVAASKRAIQSGDYIAINGGVITATSTLGDALKANDYFEMNGGQLNVPAGGIEVSAGYAIINGGVLALTSNEQDEKLLKVVKNTEEEGSDLNGTLTMNGGTLNIDVYGKGSKGLKAERDILVKGGVINAVIAGAHFMDDSGDYNVSSLGKADRQFNVTGGSVNVTVLAEALGGRGFSADSSITISGDAKVTIADDAVNYSTAKGKVKVGYALKCDGTITFAENSVTQITAAATANSAICINNDKNIEVTDNAKLYMQSASNQTMDGDGSYLSVNGGVVVSVAGAAYASTEGHRLQSKGGVFVGIGGKTATSVGSSYCLVQDASYTLGDAVNVKSAAGVDLLNFQGPSAFANSSAKTAYLSFSMPTLQSGAAYSYTTGGAISGGTSFNGYYEGASYNGGTSYSFTGVASTSSVAISK